MSNQWVHTGETGDELIARIYARVDGMHKLARDIMEKTVEDAAVDMQDRFEAAETKTGRKRVEDGRGRFAGRHVTGNLVGSITYSVERVGDTWIGRYGWPNPEDYFLDQDDPETGPSGNTNFDGVHAIAKSFITARENFYNAVFAAAGIARGF